MTILAISLALILAYAAIIKPNGLIPAPETQQGEESTSSERGVEDEHDSGDDIEDAPDGTENTDGAESVPDGESEGAGDAESESAEKHEDSSSDTRRSEPVVSPPAIASADLCSAYGESANRFWYERLTERQKGIYDVFYSTLISDKLKCHIDIDQHDDDFTKACDALYRDEPELFWFRNEYYYWWWNDPGMGMDIELYSYYDIEDVPALRQRVDDRIDEFIRSLPAGASSYEKARLAYGWVCDQCEFVYGEYDQLLTAVLLDGRAVCGGYARTYQALLNRMGIPCTMVHGTTVEGRQTGESHVWNLVCIDGIPGYVDVTYGDTSGDETDYTYFYFGDDFLNKLGHQVDDQDKAKLPTCP